MDLPVEKEGFARYREAGGFSRWAEWTSGGVTWFLGVKDRAIALYRGGEAAVHFDLEGRLRRAFFDDDGDWVNYLRGLDGRLLRKRLARRGGAGARSPRGAAGVDSPLEGAERRAIFERCHRIAAEALSTIPLAEPGAPSGDDEDPRVLLERAAAYDAERLEGEAARFLEAYRPLGVLPPDRYRSVLLQATEGCAYNGCLFCSLYRGERYRVKEPGEFREHVRRVRAFLGRALPLRRGIFLGEANAMAVELATLEALMGVVREELPAEVIDGEAREGRRDPTAGFSSFLDAFTTGERGAWDLAALGRLGLRRVFLGVETGSERLLKFLRKPASNEGVRELVGALAGAGVSVGAIVLVGAGGAQFAREHVEETVGLIRSLPLGPDDLIYLSPLVVEQGGRYDETAEAKGVEPLAAEDLASQEAELRRLLRPAPGGPPGPKVALYDIKSFVYY